jgi:hypothetical protein
LGGGRVKNAFISVFNFISVNVPDIALEAVFVVVAYEALVADLVPESATRVQHIPWHLLIVVGERSHGGRVGTLHDNRFIF